MGRMHRVREQHGFVVGQGIQEIIVALDECLLLLFVEFARDDVRLVILQPQTMQKRNQSRTAFVNEAEFLFDKGADLARRARQRRADKGLQCVFLLGAQKSSRSPPTLEAGQALDLTLFKQFEPATDRVVVQQKRIGDFLTAPPVVQKHQGICASRHARGHRPFARQRDQLVAILFAEKAASNHANIGIAKPENSRIFYRDFNELEYKRADAVPPGVIQGGEP